MTARDHTPFGRAPEYAEAAALRNAAAAAIERDGTDAVTMIEPADIEREPGFDLRQRVVRFWKALDAHDEWDPTLAAYLYGLSAAAKTGELRLLAASWHELGLYWAEQRSFARDRLALHAHVSLLLTEVEVFGVAHREVAGTWNNIGGHVGEACLPCGGEVVVDCAYRIARAIKRHHAGGRWSVEDEALQRQQWLIAQYGLCAWDRVFPHASAMDAVTGERLRGNAFRCLAYAYSRVGRFDEANVAHRKALAHVEQTKRPLADWAVLTAASTALAAPPNPPSSELPPSLLESVRDACRRSLGQDETRRRLGVDVLARAGAPSDLPLVLEAIAHGHATYFFDDLVKILSRGMSPKRVHAALIDLATRRIARAPELLARFELAFELPALASVKTAIDDGAPLERAAALLMLDAGDRAGLDEIAKTGGPEIALACACADVERDVTESSLAQAVDALRAWTATHQVGYYAPLFD